jgi:Methyltransferase FkbM domain
MDLKFLSQFYSDIYSLYSDTEPPRRWDLVDWIDLEITSRFYSVRCIRLEEVLDHANVKHVNMFVLDVEGGELSVLKSINFSKVTFDVLCIETEASYRPEGYETSVANYLADRGYRLYATKGRNTWFINNDFVPHRRPGLPPGCFSGVQAMYTHNALYRAKGDEARQEECETK